MAKNYKNESIVSIDMDKVGVMAAYSDPLCVCVVHVAFIYSADGNMQGHSKRWTQSRGRPELLPLHRQPICSYWLFQRRMLKRRRNHAAQQSPTHF